ncbi:MAG: sugar transferase [Clostridia bacterium]|nr:sugar transferase [Clostridia bacterium]
MERLITEIGQVEQTKKNKEITKSEIKSPVKHTKAFRAMQLFKMHLKNDSYIFLKRTFDICVGLVGSMLLLPIMLIVKIANLKNGDNDPVLFKQKRIGKNGKEINIYKIRSMIPNAEQVLEKLMKENPKIKEEYEKNKKLENDPRITKVGAFIRKTSLDEFGQFINILKGDMAVVGPRPYLPREKGDMGDYYNDVIQCKPGLTGLWQVEGRSDIGFENRCRLDRFYNKHKGLWFDTKIFLKTFVSVLKSKGAK